LKVRILPIALCLNVVDDLSELRLGNAFFVFAEDGFSECCTAIEPFRLVYVLVKPIDPGAPGKSFLLKKIDPNHFCFCLVTQGVSDWKGGNI